MITPKFLGSLLILGGGIWGWLQERKSRRRKLETLAALAAALSEMSESVRQDRTPFFRLLEKIQRRGTSDSIQFFKQVKIAIQNGAGASDAWIKAAKMLPLEEADIFALQEAGTALSGDAVQVCSGLSRAEQQLRRSLERAREVCPEQERRGMVLWFSGAALAVILLL